MATNMVVVEFQPNPRMRNIGERRQKWLALQEV